MTSPLDRLYDYMWGQLPCLCMDGVAISRPKVLEDYGHSVQIQGICTKCLTRIVVVIPHDIYETLQL